MPETGKAMEQTRRMLATLFAEPAPDDLYDYVAASLRGDAAAALYPAAHAWVTAGGVADEHYQTLVELLRLERMQGWEAPPLTANIDFEYLPVSAQAALRVEMGRLLIGLSARLIEAFRIDTPPALAYAKATTDAPRFSGVLVADAQGVKVTITGTASTAFPAERCTLTVGLEMATRRWPQLGGIPVVLQIGDETELALLTDAFGRVHFRELDCGALPGACIAIGALGEFGA